MMDFDAISFYPGAIYDEISVYPETESGFVFKPYMNIIYVEVSNNQTFNQDGNESANLKSKNYILHDCIFQQLPVKEEVKNIELNRMGNGYIIDTLTSVDIKEIVEIGGKVTEFYEGVIY